MAAPKVRFLTKIYRPNIDKLFQFMGMGTHVLFFDDTIQALVGGTNPDDRLSENIAKHWKTNEAEAVETAKEWTRLYASGV